MAQKISKDNTVTLYYRIGVVVIDNEKKLVFATDKETEKEIENCGNFIYWRTAWIVTFA